MTDKRCVEKFLEDMRVAIKAKKIDSVPRQETMETLGSLGLTLTDMFNELANMTYSNYCEGPEIDLGWPNEDKVWKFKLQIDYSIIYVKLKLYYQTDGTLKVLSFHFDGFR